ncbi:anti-sigma factor family protein [Aquabacterium sp. OR-4]|uniref:anti-sigma factor family protein n=1 Tax=Aquabacterium sp. OR-4 TaxID=2978127 RepID=UPI0021B1D0DF|nr:anti-sigma factor [Aquabacterium sp. OR-4]MDT7833665.1 anti-sigma factor [Aquabacterium sp. OR-4]
MDSARPPDDEHLSAWLDGELDAAAAAAVDAWLREHPEDAARVRLWAADRDALRARFAPVADEPLPEAWRRRLTAPAAAPGPAARRRLPLALAAGLLLAGGVLGGLLGAGAVWSSPALQVALQARGWTRPSPLAWTHRAAVAHAVYAPEVRHPVEVNVAQGSAAEQRAQEEHLARWLSKRLGMAVRLFDLRAQGFELVGGRLLPDAAGPSAQLMYQNSAGQRVTVYLRRPEAGAATAFRYQRDGELGLFYWTEDGFGCALVGNLPKERLLALAQAVYKQAEGGIVPAPAGGASQPAS